MLASSLSPVEYSFFSLLDDTESLMQTLKQADPDGLHRLTDDLLNASKDEHHSEKITQHGILQALVDLALTDDLVIRKQVTELFCQLSFSDPHPMRNTSNKTAYRRKAIAEAGTVSAWLSLLSDPDTTVRRHVTQVFSNLAASNIRANYIRDPSHPRSPWTPGHQSVIVDAGAIPILVSSLRDPDAQVRAHAAGTLSRLMLDNPTYEQALREHGALGAMITLCGDVDPAVQKKVLGALLRFHLSPEDSELILSGHTPNHLLRAWAHPDRTLQDRARKFLDTMNTISASHGRAQLAELCIRYLSDEDTELRRNAEEAMRSLYLYEEDKRDALVPHMKQLCQMMLHDDHGVQRAVIQFLQHYLTDERPFQTDGVIDSEHARRVRTLIGEKGGVKNLLQLLSTPGTHDEVRTASFPLLAELAIEQKNQATMLSLGAIQILSKDLSVPYPNNGAKTLCYLAKDPRHQLLIAESGHMSSWLMARALFQSMGAPYLLDPINLQPNTNQPIAWHFSDAIDSWTKIIKRAALQPLFSPSHLLARYHKPHEQIKKEHESIMKSIQSLKALLSDEEASTRQDAAGLIGVCAWLFTAHKPKDTRPQLMKTKIITALVRLLSDPHPEVKQNAAGALYMLSEHHALGDAILQTGAITDLLCLLSAPLPGIIRNSIQTIRSLISDKKDCSNILKNKSFSPFIGLLNDLDPWVVVNATDILALLSSDRTITLTPEDCAQLNTLSTHMRDDVAWAAIKVLAHLASNPSNQALIVQSGAIESLSAALEGRQEPLTYWASQALLTFASHPTYQRFIQEAGGIPRLVRLLSNRENTTQDKAIKVLAHLASEPINQRIIQEAGAIELLIPFLDRQHDSASAASILSCLALNEPQRLEILRSDAVGRVLNILTDRYHGDDKDTVAERTQALMALLYNLGSDPYHWVRSSHHHQGNVRRRDRKHSSTTEDVSPWRPLCLLLGDPCPDARTAAIEAINKCHASYTQTEPDKAGAVTIRHALILRLEDEEESIRKQALRILASSLRHSRFLLGTVDAKSLPIAPLIRFLRIEDVGIQSGTLDLLIYALTHDHDIALSSEDVEPLLKMLNHTSLDKALQVLNLLAKRTVHHTTIVQAGTITTLVDLLQRRSHDPKSLSYVHLIDETKCMRLLSTLALDPEHSRLILASGIVPILLTSLYQDIKGHPVPNAHTASLLVRLTAQPDLAAQAGVFQAAVMMLSTILSSYRFVFPGILEEGPGVSLSFSEDKAHWVNMAQAGGLQVLASILQYLEQEFNLTEQALLTLYHNFDAPFSWEQERLHRAQRDRNDPNWQDPLGRFAGLEIFSGRRVKRVTRYSLVPDWTETLQRAPRLLEQDAHTIAQLLVSHDESLRKKAASVLIKHERFLKMRQTNQSYFELLNCFLDHPHTDTRKTAAGLLALSTLCVRPLSLNLQPLLQLLTDGNPDVRQNAAGALQHLVLEPSYAAHILNTGAFQLLTASLTDTCAEVRHNAAGALRNLKLTAPQAVGALEAHAIRPLINLLSDTHPHVRLNAAAAMAAFAFNPEDPLAIAQDSIEPLVSLMTHEEPQTQDHARHALKCLAANPHHHVHFLEANSIDRLIHYWYTCHYEPDAEEDIAAILSNLSKIDPTAKERCTDVSTAIAMLICSPDADLRTTTLNVISRLSEETIRPHQQNKGARIAQAITRMSDRYSDDPSVDASLRNPLSDEEKTRLQHILAVFCPSHAPLSLFITRCLEPKDPSSETLHSMVGRLFR